jgi:hypothetical protein
MTSDAIEFKGAGYWSLNVWTNALAYTGQAPQVTIEVSNDDDTNSFTPLSGAINVNVDPKQYFDNLDSTWKYFRIVWDPKGSTAGTKNFDLIQEVQNV